MGVLEFFTEYINDGDCNGKLNLRVLQNSGIQESGFSQTLQNLGQNSFLAAEWV